MKATHLSAKQTSTAMGNVTQTIVANLHGQANSNNQLQNRDYIEALVEYAPPFLVLDQKLVVQTTNQSFCKSFNITADQVLNRQIYELGNGEWNIQKLHLLLEEVLPQKGSFDQVELTHRFTSSGFRTMLLSGRKLFPSDRIFLMIRDISECREAQAAIRASEVHYRRVFEAAGDGILLVDPHTHKITETNRYMAAMLACTPLELVGRELWEIGLFKNKKAWRDSFRELQRNHLVRYDDLQLQNKLGERLHVEFLSTLYHEGRRSIIQCNIRDITKRKRAEQALTEARNQISRHADTLEQVVLERTTQLREVMSELEGFSYSIAHDMRAPLRAMESFASFLVDEYSQSLDQQGVDYLHQIMRSAVRLDRLIQDVLNYSRILHHKIELGEVDLDQLVRDIVQVLKTGPAAQSLIDVKGKLPVVFANEALLTQCVMHILSNSLKFVSPGTIPHVQIYSEDLGTTVRLCFLDNGLGISPENHRRIFRLFEKIHPESEFEGTGVGLTIACKAADRMNARIGVESELGKGSNFWIQLKKLTL